MKQLKKNPLVQRMEDMTFPLIKPKARSYFDIWTNGEKIETSKNFGRTYLRSINDDNGFTLMPRLAWRVVAVVILGLAIIISFYIYGKR